MTGDHVGCVAKGAERPLNGQIRREHGRLCVFCLLELVLCFLELVLGQRGTKDESGERFTAENIDHGLVRLSPNLCWSGEALNQIGRHADVLAPLTWIHVDGFRFSRHGGLIGDQDTLGLQKAPLLCVEHRLSSQRLPLGKFSPRRRYEGHPERRLWIERCAGLLERLREAATPWVVIEQRPLEGNGGHGRLQGVERRRRQQQHATLHRLEFIMGHGGGKGAVEDGRGGNRPLATVGGPSRIPLRRHGSVVVRFVAFQSDVEVRATETEGRDTSTAGVR